MFRRQQTDPRRCLALAVLVALAVLWPGAARTARAAHPMPGDLAPGLLDESTSPPTYTAVGNGQVDVADVIVTLRAAVGLHQIVHGESVEEAELRQRIVDLEQRLADLEDLLVHFSRSGNEVNIVGANLHVTNGAGATDRPNGLGNVVIGYNEARGFLQDDRSGSHVLVVGSRNNYSGYGGLVVGEGNEVTAAWATVAGGTNNLASGHGAVVAAGRGNVAAGIGSAVTGGVGNVASGDDACIAGGAGNDAAGEAATVAGGTANEAIAAGSAVSGGLLNRALAEGATVGGGESRTGSTESGFVAGSLTGTP